jgi:hypothetical protein
MILKGNTNLGKMWVVIQFGKYFYLNFNLRHQLYTDLIIKCISRIRLLKYYEI